MVRYISHRMVVMYLGAVMEEGPALDLYEFPQHPYSRALTALNGPVIPHASNWEHRLKGIHQIH